MKLHLLRHAKTNQESLTGRDFDRKLLPKGIAQCALLADFMHPILKDVTIWCSAASRTRETLLLIQQGLSLSDVHYDQGLYLASRDALLRAVWNYTGDRDLLIVGHNFGISDLATYFLDEPIELRTGEYVCIDFPDFHLRETSRGTGIKASGFRPQVVD